MGSDDWRLYALNGASGVKRWAFGTGTWLRSSAAMGADGTLYVTGYGEGRLYALDGATGVKQWEFNTWSAAPASPAIGADGTVYFGSSNERLYALDGVTGAKRWETYLDGGLSASPAVGADETVYVVAGAGRLCAIDGRSGVLRWASSAGRFGRSSPAIGVDGTVYLGAYDQKVYALDAATGAKRWDFPTGGSVDSSPTIGKDGTIYIGSADHKLYALWSSSSGGLARAPWPMFQQNARHTGCAPAGARITVQPTSQTVGWGETTELNVLARGSAPLTYQWLSNGLVIAGASGARFALTNAQPNFAAGYQVVVSNSYGAVSSQAANLAVVYDPEQPLLTSGLAAYYRFDGDTADASGNRNQGLNLGAVLTADRLGAASRAYAFNGQDSGIKVRNSDSLNFQGRTGLTLAAWVQPASTIPDLQALVWKWGLGGQYALVLAVDKLGLVVGEPTRSVFSRSGLTAGAWRHVAGVYDAAAGRLRLFINGSLDAETAASVELPSTAEPIYLGRGAMVDAYFAGALDDVRIYRRALSAAEVAVLWNSGVWVTQAPGATVGVWGRSTELQVIAQSTRPLSYQWYKDNVSLTGATGATLLIPAAQLTDVGSYTVQVSNGLATLATPPTLLTVRPAEASLTISSGGYPSLTLDGVVGKTLRLDYAAELSPDAWFPVVTNTLTAPRFLWVDPQLATQPKRFFRVVAVP